MNDQATGLKIYPEIVLPDPNIQFLISELKKTYETQIEELKARIRELESRVKAPVPHIPITSRPTMRTTSEIIKALEKDSFERRFPVAVNENEK